jgi:hypothetical protein
MGSVDAQRPLERSGLCRWSGQKTRAAIPGESKIEQKYFAVRALTRVIRTPKQPGVRPGSAISGHLHESNERLLSDTLLTAIAIVEKLLR